MSILTSKQTWQRTYSGRRKPNAALSPIEQANVRRAVIFLRARYESPAELARALGLTIEALWKARSKRRPQSLRLAFLVARAAKVEIDDVLNGAWPGDGCPHCGGSGLTRPG